MRNILSPWPPGKSLASQLIATLLWILKVCHFRTKSAHYMTTCTLYDYTYTLYNYLNIV